jgi:hypothetical protein
MADPSFLTKLAIEVGIGVCTKCTAEYTKRGPSFNKVRGSCSCRRGARAGMDRRAPVLGSTSLI